MLHSRPASVTILLCASLLCAGPSGAQQKTGVVQAAPDLDLSLQYYSRVLTQEGVLRESRYEEKMLRRAGHVWVERVLPRQAAKSRAGHDSKKTLTKLALAAPEPNAHEHEHFNHVLIPRHVIHDGNQVRIEFVDSHARAVINIAPTEYENVNFDGSWANSFFVVDPQGIALLPTSRRMSAVTGARWHEREKNGLFQRVLWDDRRKIALIVESGDLAGTFFRRIEAKPQSGLVQELPWQNLKGYAQKEYADFLD